MPIPQLNLPDAGGINFSSGMIDYYKINDPVYAGEDQHGPDNRPLRNLAYRDSLIAESLNSVIESLNGSGDIGAMSVSSLSTYKPHQTTPASNVVAVEPGYHINSTGSRFIQRTTTFSSASFTPVSEPGKERYDVLAIDDAGVLSIIEGTEVTLGTGTPMGNAPDFSSTKLTLAIVKITESDLPVIEDSDITDVREFLNKGSDGNATKLLGHSLLGPIDATKDGYVWKYIHSTGLFELRPDATGGGTITVSDGVTTVVDTSTVVFVGASVVDSGGGQATVTITGSGGSATPFLPVEITNFRPDDVEASSAVNVTLWNIVDAVRFNADNDRSTWFSMDLDEGLDNTKDILFRGMYAVTSEPVTGDQVQLIFDYWIVQNGETPNIASPTGTVTETITLTGLNGDKAYNIAYATLKITNADIPDANGRICCRITRDIGTVAQEFAGGFDLISLKPYHATI